MYSPFRTSMDDPIEASASWMMALVSGDLAATMCILAVALLGFMLMTGRVALKRAALVTVGCFILLSASAMSSAFMMLASARGSSDQAVRSGATAMPPERRLSLSDYDPYAGASLRDDR